MLCGYLRLEKNFDSMESLVAVFPQDISNAKIDLDLELHSNLRSSDNS